MSTKGVSAFFKEKSITDITERNELNALLGNISLQTTLLVNLLPRNLQNRSLIARNNRLIRLLKKFIKSGRYSKTKSSDTWTEEFSSETLFEEYAKSLGCTCFEYTNDICTASGGGIVAYYSEGEAYIYKDLLIS